VLQTRTRELVVAVDPVHSQSIALLHDGEEPQRPLTHHTLGNMLSAFNVRADAVEIERADDGSFRALVRLRRGARMRRTLEVPAGDAIALALQHGCPVLIPEVVLRAAGTRKGTTVLQPEPAPTWTPARPGDWTPGLIVTRALELGARRTEIHATRRGVVTTQVTRRGKRQDICLPAAGWCSLLLGLCRLAAIDLGFEPDESRLPEGQFSGQMLIRAGKQRLVGDVKIDARAGGGDILIAYSPES
jgi:bifunctional DNase/RNase